MPRRCFALDLANDPALIAEYEVRHAPGAVWPRVLDHIRAQGIESMEIWRTGDRLFMIAEVTQDYPRDVAVPPETAAWEEAMWRFQRPLPHAAPGQKWVEMARIFDFA
jgi:L-rhamnose mutarotase